MIATAELVREVERDIDRRQEELVDLCARLVAAPSINPPGRTADVATVLRSYLLSQNVESELVSFDSDAPNVVSTMTGPNPGPHVVFNAHMDTMQPGDECAWTVPVWELTRKQGRLYGLGMGNMKGGLAAMALVMTILNRHVCELRGKLSFTAVCDEVMFGGRGSEFLLHRRPDFFGDFMISGEGPGFMHFAVAEKGLLWVDAKATGISGHSSGAMRRETAVGRLAAFLADLDDLNDTYANVPLELAEVTGGDKNLGLRLSVSVGTIEAGAVRSLMPPSATARIDIRIPPGITVTEVKKRLEALETRSAGITLQYPKEWNANWTPKESRLVIELASAVERVRGSAPQRVVRLPSSDARHWRDRGVPAACYGPQPTLSAGVDDYAEERDVVHCAKVYAITALKLMEVDTSALGLYDQD